MKKQLLTFLMTSACLSVMAQSNYYKMGLVTDLAQLQDGDMIVLQNVNTGYTGRNGYVVKSTDDATLKTNVGMFCKPESNEFKKVFNASSVFRVDIDQNGDYKFYSITGNGYLLNNLGNKSDASIGSSDENNQFTITASDNVDKAWAIKSTAENGTYLHGEDGKTIFYNEPHPYRIIKVSTTEDNSAPNNWYSVWNEVRPTRRMFIDANNHNFLGMTDPQPAMPSNEAYLWTIEEDSENPEKCTFISHNSSEGSMNWIGLGKDGNVTATHANTTRFAYDQSAKHYNLNMVKPAGSPYPYATFKFQPDEENGSALYINQAAGGQGYYINYYSDNEGTYAFTFSINAQLKDTGEGYALGSFIAPYRAAIPDGVEVYIATGADSDLLLTKKEGTSIPENTAVILKANTAGFYEILPASDSDTDIDATGNILKGCAFDQEITPVEGAYVLGNVNGTTSMYNYTGTTIPMYRAYLPKNNSAQQIKNFIFDENGTTGITEINTSTDENGIIYDLSGRQVVNPSQGIYIKNGKKFIVK